MLLPPKSLRSRFGDSERFKPLQREGDRFTADGEEEGVGERRDKEWQVREKRRRRKRERGAVYRGPTALPGSGGIARAGTHTPLEPRKGVACWYCLLEGTT